MKIRTSSSNLKSLWKCSEFEEVDLISDNIKDMHLLLNLLSFESNDIMEQLKCYNIRLNSITDCRNYCSLVENYSFQGYIMSDNRIIHKNDIIEIMEYCFFKNIKLIALCSDIQEYSSIHLYLENTRLSIPDSVN